MTILLGLLGGWSLFALVLAVFATAIGGGWE